MFCDMLLSAFLKTGANVFKNLIRNHKIILTALYSWGFR